MGLIALPIIILEIITLPITFPFRYLLALVEEMEEGFDFKRLFSF